LQSIPVDVIAIIAAITMSTMSVCNRQGLTKGSPFMAAVIINATVLVTYFTISTARGVSWQSLPSAGVYWFLLAGFCSPALSMTVYYISLSRFGVAKSAPIAMGANPLFSVILAITLLGERPGWSLYLGTVLIVGGIWIISRPKGGIRLKWNEIIIPLGAGFFWGLAATIRKFGFGVLPDPQIAAVIQSFSALVVLLAMFWVFPKGKRFVRSWHAFKFFLLAGVSFTITIYFLLSAIWLGEVSRVMAIVGTTPLLSVALAALFLGDLEVVTARTYAGAACVVGGVIFITLLRG
jgi:uncharacterized membrane protein